MNVGQDGYAMPLRLYRRGDEIRDDISDVKRKIEEIGASLSIREMLMELISDKRERCMAEWLYDIEAILGDAEKAYYKLGDLREELRLLEAELSEASGRFTV